MPLGGAPQSTTRCLASGPKHHPVHVLDPEALLYVDRVANYGYSEFDVRYMQLHF